MVTESPSRVLYGGLIIVGAMSIIGLIDNFIRYAAEDASLWQFHFFRSVVACAIIAVYCLVTKTSVKPRRPWGVWIRSMLMAGAILIYFGSILVMPIAEAGAALFSAPIFLVIFSVLLLRIRVGPWRLISVVVGFTGVLLILKPDPNNLDVFTLVPIIAGIFYALGQMITRHWCADEDTIVVLLFFFVAIGLCGLLGTVALTVFPAPQEWSELNPNFAYFWSGWTPPTKEFLFWSLIQGVGSLIGVAGLVRGYQVAEPTFVSVFEYSFLVFAGFWGWVLWKEIPDPLSAVGIVAIIIAGMIITLRSRRAA